MNVFIDCGTNLCQGLTYHVEKYGIDTTWKIFSFEANPTTYTHANRIIEKYYSHLNISLLNKAVWIDDCTKSMIAEYAEKSGVIELLRRQNFDSAFLDLNDDESLWVGGASSIMGDDFRHTSSMHKVRHHTNDVQCVDFNNFLEASCDPSDDLFIKLDIEGAEYAVLYRLLEYEHISSVKEITIEWHDYIKDSKAKKNDLINRLLHRHINILDWR